MEEQKKFCPQCGNPVSASGKFCGKCGYRFELRQTAAEPPAQSVPNAQAPEANRQAQAAENTQQSLKERMKASFEAGMAKGQAVGNKIAGSQQTKAASSNGLPAQGCPPGSQTVQGASAKKFCRQCGNQVSPTAKFCGKCGFRFDTVPAAPPQSTQSAQPATPPGAPLPHAQQGIPQQGAQPSFQQSVPGSNRRGNIKASPLGRTARESLRGDMPSPGQAKRFGKGTIAAVLAVAVLLTGLAWPGWIRHMFDRPNTPPQTWTGGTGTGGSGSTTGGSTGYVSLSSLSSPLSVGYLDGVGDGVGFENTYVETPVVSSETVSVPSDGSPVTASCGATIELGELNAGAVDEITVTEHAPETQTIPGGQRVCYDIDAGGRHEFDYFFDISLPYDPAGTDPSDEAGSVFAEWLNEETGEWEPEICDVDTVNHRVIIHTNHFSGHAPVTVQNSKLVYVELVKLGDLYISDETALKNIKTHMGELQAEYKEDPVAVGAFYHLLFKTAESATFGYISDSEIEQAVNEAFGQKDGLFNDIMGWITSFAYDIASYANIVPESSLLSSSVSYLPGNLFVLGANYATFLSAASLAESVYNELEQKGNVSRETVMSLYKWALNVAFASVMAKLGVAFGSFYALPVIAVDYGLVKFNKAVQDAEDDAMAKALYSYYKEYYARPLYRDLHKRSDISGADLPEIERQSWMNRLTAIVNNNAKKHKSNAQQLSATINAALNRDISQAYTGLSAEAHGEGDMAIAMQEGIPDNERVHVWSTWETLNPSRQNEVSDRAVKLLMKDLEPVFLEIANQQRLAYRQQATDCAKQVSKALNTRHTLIIEEKIAGGESSQYAGCKVVFTHHRRTVADNPYKKDGRLVEWQGVLDQNGGMVVSFNTFGYLKAGVPDKVRIYTPDADLSTSIPILEVDFEVRQKTTKIILGDVPYTWFEGSWRWEDTHGTESKLDDEAFDLAILSVDATHAYMRETDVWGDGGMNLLYAEYDAFEDALILSDLGTKEPVLVLENKGTGPDRIAVTGLSADEVIMTRTQQDNNWWNDRRLERDQLVQMAVDQGYMTR